VSNKCAMLMLSTALVPALWAGSAHAQAAGVSSAASSGQLAEVVVTATREAQPLSRVPISVTAFTQATMDAEGVRSVADLSRMTPGLNFSTHVGNRGASNITIRGVSSIVGAATTGIYIDDTPIQVRSNLAFTENAYPALFDLERVEVLRGPQGTLFGAGSEGGTVRFIRPEPSLTRMSTYARAELSGTRGSNDHSYEFGAAEGGPLIRDKLGFRISADHRRDGGWIDRDTFTSNVLDPTGLSGPGSITFSPTSSLKNANRGETTVISAALKWAATGALTISPSIVLQKRHLDDNPASIWPAGSNLGSSHLVAPAYLAVVDATHVPLTGNVPALTDPLDDKWALPALKVDWDLGAARLTGNLSYFMRTNNDWNDTTYADDSAFGGVAVPKPGDKAQTYIHNQQNNLTAELRIQSPNPDARLNWQVGVFSAWDREMNVQNIHENFFATLQRVSLPPVPGFAPTAGVPNGAPYGPGSTALENFFGIDMLNGKLGDVSVIDNLKTYDKQLAGFGSIDFAVTQKLKLTAGVRVASSTFDFDIATAGLQRNQNAPLGNACIPGTGVPGAAACVPVPVGAYAVGTGPFTPAYNSGKFSNTEHPVTPKFAINYQADERNLYYIGASKGYRIGGAQNALPADCSGQIAQYGYLVNGRPSAPSTYNSDTLWSYEAGAKNRLFDGKLSVQSSVYLLRWNHIQSQVYISSCQNSFIANLGGATGKGFDLQAQAEPVRHLSMGLSVAYVQTRFDGPVILGGKTLYSANTALPDSGAPWTVILNTEYDFSVMGRDSYVRGDYTYTSKWSPSGATDRSSVNFDPALRPNPVTNTANVRAGVRFSGIDLSAFANNVTNAHPAMNRIRSRLNVPVFTENTLRPRSIGITAEYRY
jgi:iron complex outermembrane receptor protein